MERRSIILRQYATTLSWYPSIEVMILVAVNVVVGVTTENSTTAVLFRTLLDAVIRDDCDCDDGCIVH